MWKALQVAVAMSFLFANIHWQWMDNPFVAAVNAGFLAMFVTWLLSKSIDLVRRWRKPRGIGAVEQGRNNGGNSRVGSGL
jgi:hypothetical protein